MPPPKALGDNDQAKVNVTADNLHIRNRAMIEFMFSSGCRVNELVNIRISDVDKKDCTVLILGKGNKERIIHFSDTCMFLLDIYLSDPKCKPASNEDYLFRSMRRNRQLSNGDVRRMINKLGKEAGVVTKVNPHTARHTFTTNLIRNGATIEFAAEELGHANLNTTKRYIKMGVRDPRVKILYHKCMR